MTEAEWLACGDPQPMLEFLRGKASDRKLRLFACACCRLVWDQITLESQRGAVETSERYADGLVTDSEREREQERVYLSDRRGVKRKRGLEGRSLAVQLGVWVLTDNGANAAEAVASRLLQLPDGIRDRVLLLMHEVFYNLFRPVAADPRWLTSTVRDLARAIYAERAFDRLPILADALEDAGCDDADVLAHCRGDGPHVRGCWAVDLVLGKT